MENGRPADALGMGTVTSRFDKCGELGDRDLRPIDQECMAIWC